MSPRNKVSCKSSLKTHKGLGISMSSGSKCELNASKSGGHLRIEDWLIGTKADSHISMFIVKGIA